jgi:GT2 family glycosyltransferase
LDSIVTGDYPPELLEVVVVDGMSDDGSREIAAEYAERFPFVRLLANPRKITPVALNLGIRQTTGKLVFWMSAHNRYVPDYISRSVDCLLKYGADNVGGGIVPIPREQTIRGRGIAAAISHPFGVGNSRFRVRTAGPQWVDTVFGGCYRREVFHRIGLFNEFLVRGQDMEFNLRLKSAGGRTFLFPDITSHYFARSTILAFWRHNWINGLWAILPFFYSPIVPVRGRHLVPGAFVAILILAGILALTSPAGVWFLGVLGGMYALAAVLAATHVAFRERDARMLFAMPLTFANLHVAYGLGSLAGALLVAGRWLAGQRRPEAAQAWPEMSPRNASPSRPTSSP